MDGIIRFIFDETVLEVEHLCVVVDLRVTFFNDLMSKVDINFVSSKSIPPGKYFDGWNWVIFYI